MTKSNNDPPGLHPLAPSNLAQIELPIYLLTSGNIVYRVHQTKYDPIYFGRSGASRFDDPNNQFGVLYLASDCYCAFRETIGRFSKYRLISTQLLSTRRVSLIRNNKDLNLVDLTGSGLTKIEADGRLLTGSYKISQSWSKAFYSHPSCPDGIYYRSRHDPSRYCLALYSRCSEFLELTQIDDFLSTNYREILAKILDAYDYGLLQ